MKAVNNMDLEIALGELPQASWEIARARAHRWISDLEFLRVEIAFLQHILQRAGVWMKDEETADSAGAFGRKLGNLELRRDLFARVVKYHLKQMESVIENPFVNNGQEVKDDHSDLEKRIAGFIKEVRTTKLAVFHFIERVVDPERLPHLLEARGDREMMES